MYILFANICIFKGKAVMVLMTWIENWNWNLKVSDVIRIITVTAMENNVWCYVIMKHEEQLFIEQLFKLVSGVRP